MRIFSKGLLVMAVLFLFQSCYTYKEVEFKKVNSFSMGKVEDGKVDFRLNVQVYNPNRYKIKIIKGEMDLSLAGSDAGSATLLEKVKLKGKEENDYNVIIQADFKQLTKALLASSISIALTKTAMLKVKGWFKGRVFIFGKKFPVEFKEQLDLNQFKNK